MLVLNKLQKSYLCYRITYMYCKLWTHKVSKDSKWNFKQKATNYFFQMRGVNVAFEEKCLGEKIKAGTFVHYFLYNTDSSIFHYILYVQLQFWWINFSLLTRETYLDFIFINFIYHANREYFFLFLISLSKTSHKVLDHKHKKKDLHNVSYP